MLGDPVRLRLLSLIAAQPGGACACDLTDEAALSQPTVSHHLKILLDSGPLTQERRGQFTHYRVDPDRLGILRAALSTRPDGVMGEELERAEQVRPLP